jgi:hypothetical protein
VWIVCIKHYGLSCTLRQSLFYLCHLLNGIDIGIAQMICSYIQANRDITPPKSKPAIQNTRMMCFQYRRSHFLAGQDFEMAGVRTLITFENLLAVQKSAIGTYHPRLVACMHQDVIDHSGSCRFAIGPGDGDDRQGKVRTPTPSKTKSFGH